VLLTGKSFARCASFAGGGRLWQVHDGRFSPECASVDKTNVAGAERKSRSPDRLTTAPALQLNDPLNPALSNKTRINHEGHEGHEGGPFHSDHGAFDQLFLFHCTFLHISIPSFTPFMVIFF